jgi:protein involved in polysaccharide export with SLBB domain
MTIFGARLSRRSSRFIPEVLVSALLVVMVAIPLAAQRPTEQQVRQQLQQNPQLGQLVRQRIQQSGLSQEQIRARLSAAGYSPSLLDTYLDEGAPGSGTPAPSEEMLMALSALGVGPLTAEGIESVPVTAGFAPVPQPLPSSSFGLQLFGADIFRRSTTQFQPLLTGPVPPSYRLGPGDVMVLVLTGDVELVHSLEVTREGFIVIPQVGQLFVNEITMEELQNLLRQRLGRSYSGIARGTTRFDVSIARLRANQVYVVGEVVQPGAYQLASVATVLNALYAAGGPVDRGNFRHIEVRRRGETAGVLDLYDYLLRGDTRNDLVLEQGDIVFVPVMGTRATIAGAVVRPAIYELQDGETLAELIESAGGFLADAELSRVTVHRVLPADRRGQMVTARVALDVPLRRPRTGDEAAEGSAFAVPALPLEDGDSVIVDFLPDRGTGYFVRAAGMVYKPGAYPWQEGMTLRELLKLAGGLRIGASLEAAEIARLPADRMQGDLADTLRVPLDSTYLFDRDSLGRFIGPPGLPYSAAGAPEVGLEPFDNILILKQPEFDFQRTVTITGEVRYPGTYSLTRKDERLSELVERAGGLLTTAYPAGARFYRAFEDAGRVNVDLSAVLAAPDGAEDLILQPDDSLAVPEYLPTVRVIGAVNAPTSVLWQEGANLDYYIANAGGFAEDANKGAVVVQFANGSAQTKKSRLIFFSSSPRPGPGSQVLIPAKQPREPTNWIPIVAALASILASTASVAIALSR